MSAEPSEIAEPTGAERRTTAGKAEILKARRTDAANKRQAAIDKQHAKGKMTALERIEAFLDEGSFQQIDGLTRHRSHNFGQEKNRPFGDGVLTGATARSTAGPYVSSRRTSPSSADPSARFSARKSSRSWISR